MSLPSTTPSNQPTNGLGLSSALDTSDIVLIGKVVDIQAVGIDPSSVSLIASSESDQVIELTLDISEVLKGQYSHRQILVHTLEGILPGRPWSAFEMGKQYLLCLHEKDQKFTLASFESPAIDLPFSPYKFNRTEPYVQQVASLLEQVILLSGDSTPAPMILEIAITRASLNEPISRNTRLSISTPPTQKAAIILILLSQGDSTGLSQYQELLNRVDNSQETMDILISAASHLPRYNQPSFLPVLSSLTDYDQEAISLAAIQTVRATDSPLAESILIRALYKDLIQIRYQAVCGLAERNPGKMELPSYDLFASQESKFLSFWKEWATSKNDN